MDLPRPPVIAAVALICMLGLPTPVQAAVSEPMTWEVVSRRPHDPQAFTQGLVLGDGGRLFESTGRYGDSTLRETDALSGDVVRAIRLPDDQWGEGLALVDDVLIGLTWKAGTARAWDAATFEPVATFGYEGQGWGLCYDDERLVMSDGSDRLTFRDPLTFEPTGFVTVALHDQPIERLNELECVDGMVWANVWKTDQIVRIDPIDGTVTGVLDLRGILEPHPADRRSGSVLNGIAYDAAAETYLVTGKRWPELIEIRVLEPPEAPGVAEAPES